jgi:hypothetical protein
MQSNRDSIVDYRSIYSCLDLYVTYEPKVGFAAAKIEVLEFNMVVIPAFAIEMVYCSMASWIATQS